MSGEGAEKSYRAVCSQKVLAKVLGKTLERRVIFSGSEQINANEICQRVTQRRQGRNGAYSHRRKRGPKNIGHPTWFCLPCGQNHAKGSTLCLWRKLHLSHIGSCDDGNNIDSG